MARVEAEAKEKVKAMVRVEAEEEADAVSEGGLPPELDNEIQQAWDRMSLDLNDKISKLAEEHKELTKQLIDDTDKKMLEYKQMSRKLLFLDFARYDGDDWLALCNEKMVEYQREIVPAISLLHRNTKRLCGLRVSRVLEWYIAKAKEDFLRDFHDHMEITILEHINSKMRKLAPAWGEHARGKLEDVV